MSVLDRFKLTGKTALVTGGARGLGKTMATALAEAGADLALTGRSRETCETAAKEISDATGRTVHAFGADVTSGKEVERLHAEVTAACGDVDILINNAGTNIRGTLDQLSETDWDSV
ncbi:MAG TPA: SDR family NAD(P)-dependent oxidoreductase, partial [Vicinamibacterales bacterium]